MPLMPWSDFLEDIAIALDDDHAARLSLTDIEAVAHRTLVLLWRECLLGLGPIKTPIGLFATKSRRPRPYQLGGRTFTSAGRAHLVHTPAKGSPIDKEAR